MRTRLTKLAVALAALAALAVGGSTLASAGSKAKPQAPPTASQSEQEPASAVDGDNVQEGDQSAPDTTSQASEAAGEQAAESGPSDGPGGYADANVKADTQQQGEH